MSDRTMSKGAIRLVASIFGVLAGLLGIEHGYFETLQGSSTPGSIYILAIGPPCQTTKMWHACEPAMTVIPNYLASGVLAIIVSLIIIIWAAAFVQRKNGGLILILLSILQLLVGGGFIPVVYGIIAGIVGTRIHKPLTWWCDHLTGHTRSILGALWPWPLIALVIWSSAEWILGSFFNDLLQNLAPVTMLFSIVLVVLAVLTAFAHDIQRKGDSHAAISMSG